MFSQTVEYALRAVVHLADQSPSPRTTDQIATATLVPKAYLSKVLQGLCRAKIVQSKRGIGGGMVAGEIPVRVDHSGCRQCRGTDWPNSRMPARIDGSRRPSVPVAQAAGQCLGDGRRSISANDAGRDLGRTDQEPPAVRVPLLPAQPEVMSDGSPAGRSGCAGGGDRPEKNDRTKTRRQQKAGQGQTRRG